MPGQDDTQRNDTQRNDTQRNDTQRNDTQQKHAHQGHAQQAEGRPEDTLQEHPWELPWAEPFAADSPERARLATEFAAAIRKTGSLMQLVGQFAADRIGINSTDLNCLNILSFSGQMTAGELARATGLTTASITGVLDRLEEAGYVRRQRDSKDRRRVVVHLELEQALSKVAPQFLPLVRAWQDVVVNYTDDELRLIVDFYGRMEQVFRDHVVRLRGDG